MLGAVLRHQPEGHHEAAAGRVDDETRTLSLSFAQARGWQLLLDRSRELSNGLRISF